MNSKGFTLIELMVVMGIIGLLATLALPGYQSYRVQANNAAAVSEIHLIHLVELAFYDNNAAYADYTVGDISANGAVNKTVTINGIGHNFTLFNLNVNVVSLVKMNASGQFAIIAVRANGGDIIIAMELEQSATLRVKNTPSLTSADIPSPTNVIDLTAGWNNW